MKKNYKKETIKFLKMGCLPHVFLGDIIPIYLDSRKISFCFEDELLISDFKQAAKIGKKLIKNYQIMMIPIVVPYGDEALKILFFIKDQKLLEELDNFQKFLLNNNSFKKDPFENEKIINKLGEILNYPKCCIKNFVNTRKKKNNIEEEYSKKLSKKEINNFLPFFAYEFYPCSFTCKKSVDIGKKISSSMKKEDKFLDEAFKIILEMNHDKLKNIYHSFEDRFNNRINWNGKIYELAKRK